MITKIGNIFFIRILCILFFSSFAYGIDSLVLSIKNAQGQPARIIPAGESFYVVLTIKGDYKGKIPAIPGFERIRQLGTQTSSSYYSQGQKSSQELVYTYQVQSYNLAAYTFGPLVLEYAGQSYTAPAVEVEIVKEQQIPISQQLKQDTLLKIVTNKKSMVLGEDFFVTLKFYTRVSGIQIQTISPLEVADAQVSAWKEVSQKEEEYNGETYLAMTLSCRVQPQKIGAFTLPAVRVTYTKPVQNNQAHNFFAVFLGATVKTEHLTTDPLGFTVLALPKTDKFVQAVGSFNDFIITIDKHTARQGEAFIVTAKVAGKSAQEDLSAPVLVVPESFKSYPSRAQTVDAQEEKNRARIFEYILQGTEAGVFDFPEQQFTFFDPESKKYKTLQSSGFKLTVTGTTHEIKHIKQESQELPEERLNQTSFIKKTQILFLTLSNYYVFFLCFLLFIFFLLLMRFAYKPMLAYYCALKIKKERTAAFASAHKKIMVEEKKMQPDILSIFITLFSKKLSVAESSLTYDKLSAALSESNLTEAELHAWQEFLDALFGLKFGTQQENRAVYISSLFQQAKKWLVRLENK